MTFYREECVKSVRKPHQCSGCCTIIGIGLPALRCAGVWDGDFWSAVYHTDCRKAELALNDLHEVRYGDDFYPLSDIDWEDYPWLIEKHPAVAERMNITTARFAEIQSEREQCRAAFAKRHQHD